ncbi:MAG: serine hydrolase [Candidatus Methanoperedens sp.]|nr:serine hydrolase [Candidatus Methanoperedens sp.]
MKKSSTEIEKVIQERVDGGYSVSIVVGVLDENGSKFYNYGRMAKNSTQDVNENTIYEIGSITKVITSLILADMVEEGELSLDDPIDKFLPREVKIPLRKGKKITLKHLATHTSGLPSMPENFAPKDMRIPYVDYTVGDMYDFLSHYTLTRDIGAQYEYSNLGVGLLGHILSSKSNMIFEQLVVKRICNELGLINTTISLTPQQQALLAKGHVGDIEVTNWDFLAFAGAGALRSTASDMLTFLSAEIGLKESRLYSAMEKTQIPYASGGITGLEMGLGWHIHKKFDSEIIWHNGGTGGYHSFIGFDKKNKKAVVVLSNSADDIIDDIGLHILNKNFELKILKKAVKVDTSIYDDYIGEYELAPNTILTISREGNKLFAHATGQVIIEIFPLSETRYFFKVVNAEISFIRDKEGKVNELTLHQEGDHTAKRIK